MFPRILGPASEIVGQALFEKFSLALVDGFPETAYHDRIRFYTDLEHWYSGQALEEKQTQGRLSVDKWPIKINPIRGACHKHVHALFGEAKDDSRPLITPQFQPDEISESAKKIAQAGQNWLNWLWYESNGRSLMLRNGLLSQILGGSVFKISYKPTHAYRRIPLRIESVHPSNFVGVPMASDEFRLQEAWIVRAISPEEAERTYGMDFSEEKESGDNVYYIEYWSPDYFYHRINNRSIPTGETDDRGRMIYYEGPNRFGFVPIVYIPHIRSTGFYGDSLISPDVIGIVKELNTRVADFGDSVSDDSHRVYVGSGFQGRPELYDLAPGIRIIQLPSAPSITGKESSPELAQLGSGTASAPMAQLTKDLYEHFRRAAAIPAVADGEDEGSQRSALTLAMRMWPLMSHIQMERVFWGDAFSHLNRMAIEMALSIKTDLPGLSKKMDMVTEDLLDMRLESRFSPILPRDREAFVDEIVQRAAVNMGSLEHLLSLLDDIEDPSGEYKAIIQQMKDLAQIDIEKAKASRPPQPINQDQKSQPTSKKE